MYFCQNHSNLWYFEIVSVHEFLWLWLQFVALVIQSLYALFSNLYTTKNCTKLCKESNFDLLYSSQWIVKTMLQNEMYHLALGSSKLFTNSRIGIYCCLAVWVWDNYVWGLLSFFLHIPMNQTSFIKHFVV